MKLSFIVLLGLAAASLGTPKGAWAFPELVRKGYGNCITCHVSPSGGGNLTEYGRELSHEVLSTWGGEKESKFAYGVVNLPEQVMLGGDFRFLQYYLNNAYIVQANYFFMENDLEGAVKLGKFTLDATGGVDYQANPISRRHFLLYQATDEIEVRAGRFFPAYGIYDPNHYLTTRSGIGWDQGMETYNVEAAWIGDTFNLFATGILGRPDMPSLNREAGGALSTSLYFHDRYKAGVSYYYGYNTQGSRQLVGPYGILGFTPQFFLLEEIDYQISNQTSPGTQGILNSSRLDYEFVQGVHGFLSQEFSKTSFMDPTSTNERYGFGAQWFPRPHWEIEAMWEWQLTPALANSGLASFAWVQLHFYP